MMNYFRQVKLTFWYSLFGIGLLWSTSSSAAPGLSLATYKSIKQVESYQEKHQFKKALKLLLQLQHKNKLKAYDLAIVKQYLAYVYAALAKPQESLKMAQEVIKNEHLPRSAKQSLRFLIAQSALQEHQYQLAVNYLNQWLQHTQKIDPGINYLLSYCLFQLKQWDEAEQQLQYAISQKNPPPNNWYELLLSISIAQKDNLQTESILHHLISISPNKKKWWQQLSQFYLQQQWDNKALAAMILANQSGDFNSAEFKQILQFYHYLGMPEKAARALSTALKQNQLAESYSNYHWLFLLWFSAHEYSQAIQALDLALHIKPNAEDFRMLGLIYLKLEDWANTLESFQQALHYGYQDLFNDLLSLIQAAYHEKDFATAKKTLRLMQATFKKPGIESDHSQTQENSRLNTVDENEPSHQYYMDYWEQKLNDYSNTSIPLT